MATIGRGTFVPLPRSLGMLSPGDPAPDFDLQGTAGGGVGTYRLSAATNRAPAVVAFAPGDASDSRTLLIELAQADWASVSDAVAVFGVLPAVSTTASHSRRRCRFPTPCWPTPTASLRSSASENRTGACSKRRSSLTSDVAFGRRQHSMIWTGLYRTSTRFCVASPSCSYSPRSSSPSSSP